MSCCCLNATRDCTGVGGARLADGSFLNWLVVVLRHYGLSGGNYFAIGARWECRLVVCWLALASLGLGAAHSLGPNIDVRLHMQCHMVHAC